MACPDCGSSFGEYRISSSVETHGLDCGPFERFEQEYIVCRECRREVRLPGVGQRQGTVIPTSETRLWLTPG